MVVIEMEGYFLYLPWRKTRSRLGKWLDDNEVSQEWLSKETGLNRNTISDLCDGTVDRPRNATRLKIIKALRQVDASVSATEFW